MESEHYNNSSFQEVNNSKEIYGASLNHSGDVHMLNGISNGFSDKHKKREDKERHKDKHKDKHRDKEHRHSSEHKSKDRDKDRHSSSSKDKERREDKDRDRHKEKHKDEKRDKEREHKSSSSSHKDRDRSEHKDKDRSKHSASSSKDKDKHSSSKDREKEKHRDKEKHSSSSKDRDKEKHRSDKEKSRHSSSSKDKEKRDREKERREEKSKYEKDNKDRVKKQIFNDDSSEVDHPAREIKMEPVTIKEEQDTFNSFIDDDRDELQMDIKEEESSEDEMPLSDRTQIKDEPMSEDEDDIPLSARKIKNERGSEKKKKKRKMDSDDEEEFQSVKKKPKKASKPVKTEITTESPRKRKKPEEEQEVWKWWEEEKKPDGVKWTFLEHKGPVFAPDYEPLPSNVKFFYNGDEMRLSQDAEEVATFYARMLNHDYTTKDIFNSNFFKDWRKTMTSKEKEKITDLSKCDFRQMHAYFEQKSEERRAMSKEEKKAIKEKNDEIMEEYGYCTIDGHKEKIGNFKIEPPGLFRGRGEHPKMGMLKKRVLPEEVLINCSKDSKIPVPPPGHKWKEVRHDNTVTWLASWTENVQGQVKYVMLNPSSKLKGEKDWQKYETARKLAKSIDKIRAEYRDDWKSKEMRIRQRAVALYFIDILALRAGNEKDEDQADTVGCCSLRVEHITLHPEKDGKEYVVVFDFLGKDSIRYYNEVPVEKRVFKNLQLFMEGKKGSDDLFDRLNTTILNKHLSDLMEGLTAKVFRTYNASWTLQQQLKELTDPNYSVPELILAYNRANRAVAILCNHQRSIPKTHQKSMDTLKGKISAKKEQIEEAEKQYKYAKKEAKNGSQKEKINADKMKKKLDRLREQLTKLEVQETDKEENKTIALGTSKLNYLDPRITVAWCKKFNVPIEKIYNKTQRQKFRWAIDMAGPDYVF